MKNRNRGFLLALSAALLVASAAPMHAAGLSDVTTEISGLSTVMLAGVAAIVTAGVTVKVIPMGIRFLSKVWRSITA